MTFEVGIGTSRKWNPEEAARDVIQQAKSSIKNTITVAILFSTIHYEKDFGFKRILKTIYEQIPREIPLIGGTTPGYMTNEKCGTRGISLLLISSDEIKIASGIGKNTKGNPVKAAKQLIKSIKDNEPKDFKNKILIEVMSGPTMPTLPMVRKMNLIKSSLLGNIASKLLPISSLIGYGVAKDDDVLSVIDSYLPEYYLIGGANIDDGSLSTNFQFFNKEVLSNSIVGLAIFTNDDLKVDGFLEMQKASEDFEITKRTRDGRVIKEIEGKPAAKKFLEKIGLDDIAFKDKSLLYRTTLFYPLGFSDKPGSSTAIGAVYGSNILIGHKVSGNKAYILSATGKYIFETPTKLKDRFSEKKKLMFVSACETGLEGLGRKINNQKERLVEVSKETPFFCVFFGGEHYKRPGQKTEIRTHSFNSVIFE